MTKTGQLSTRRAKWVDYSAPGTFHLQLETLDNAPAFGVERNGVITLSECGEILLNVLAMALHRFACVSLKSMEILPHCLILVLVIDSRRISFRSMIVKAFSGLRIRRLMTIPMFVGYLKMNSARRINQYILHRQSGAVWKRRYKDRLMTDSREIAELCAQLDANFSRLRLSVRDASGTPGALSLATVLQSLFVGLRFDEPPLSASVQSPEGNCDMMILGRAFFMPSSLLNAGAESACAVMNGESDPAGAGGPCRRSSADGDHAASRCATPHAGPRVGVVGPGRIFLSLSREQ
jgi:putative transposase